MKEQFYGLCTDEQNTLLWVIRASDTVCLSVPADLEDFEEWPKGVNPVDTTGSEMRAFRESVKALDTNSHPLSWYQPFDSAELVRPALTAPVCQLV